MGPGPRFLEKLWHAIDTRNFWNIYIRLDIRLSRAYRIQYDNCAFFSTIWVRFIPGFDITVDEQVFPTMSRCPFTQYMLNKPDKIAVNFWLAVDAKSHYLINGFPYLAKNDQRPQNQSLSECVVMKLVEHLLNKGRNVTCYNFFYVIEFCFISQS